MNVLMCRSIRSVILMSDRPKYWQLVFTRTPKTPATVKSSQKNPSGKWFQTKNMTESVDCTKLK